MPPIFDVELTDEWLEDTLITSSLRTRIRNRALTLTSPELKRVSEFIEQMQENTPMTDDVTKLSGLFEGLQHAADAGDNHCHSVCNQAIIALQSLQAENELLGSVNRSLIQRYDELQDGLCRISMEDDRQKLEVMRRKTDLVEWQFARDIARLISDNYEALKETP